MYGASAVEAGRTPRGLTFTRGNMNRHGRRVQPKIEVQNPRLRELAEAAYEIRTQVRTGTPLYWRLSNAVRGDISPSMYTILTALHGQAADPPSPTKDETR